MLESLTCGDTHIPSVDFGQVLNDIKKKSHSGETELEKQFQVFVAKPMILKCILYRIIIADTGQSVLEASRYFV